VSRKNMHALDADGALRLWSSAEEIVDYFVAHRAPFYELRHAARTAKLEADIAKRERTLRLCERVASGDVSMLEGASGAQDDDALDVPLRACTPARRAALAAQIAALRSDLERHEASSPTDAWVADLDALRDAL
jgi:hypothetical protein